jgi:hypothetical protein
LQFSTTGYFQQIMHRNGVNNPYVLEITSSALGGLCPTLLTCPIELVNRSIKYFTII